MATQRITMMKVAGIGGDHIADRLQSWAAQRTTETQCEWLPEQWPASVCEQVDRLASQLRDHPTPPPVIHFVEWIDQWSMGDLFDRWLHPANRLPKLVVHGQRFEIHGYSLPDDGRLLDILSKHRKLQWPEQDWFVKRLHEAITAWDALVDRSFIVVLREVFGGLATDAEIVQRLTEMPDWLSETGGQK